MIIPGQNEEGASLAYPLSSLHLLRVLALTPSTQFITTSSPYLYLRHFQQHHWE